ncbi:MAG: hypothetical protein DRO88_11075 [Promethearchaeia archaeon]|nr:MAG: hypothetical protein DRO88_11075 [Candidatus Lokiarchaeia archaeon]
MAISIRKIFVLSFIMLTLHNFEKSRILNNLKGDIDYYWKIIYINFLSTLFFIWNDDKFFHT